MAVDVLTAGGFLLWWAECGLNLGFGGAAVGILRALVVALNVKTRDAFSLPQSGLDSRDVDGAGSADSR
jgi:hypothetical protein